MTRALPTQMVSTYVVISLIMNVRTYSWKPISGLGFSPRIRPVMLMAVLVAMRVYSAPAISWIDPERAERNPDHDINGAQNK